MRPHLMFLMWMILQRGKPHCKWSKRWWGRAQWGLVGSILEGNLEGHLGRAEPQRAVRWKGRVWLLFQALLEPVVWENFRILLVLLLLLPHLVYFDITAWKEAPESRSWGAATTLGRGVRQEPTWKGTCYTQNVKCFSHSRFLITCLAAR
jgi:hypothetical protein